MYVRGGAFHELFESLVDEIYGFLYVPKPTRDAGRTLKWVARRLGGDYQPARRDRGAAIAWTLEKASALFCLVEEGGKIEGYALRIRMACPFRLRLLPETAWTRVRRFFGAQDLRTEDDPFDRTFVVQADQPSRVRSLLTREIRAGLTALSRLGPVTLEVAPTGLVLRTSERFKDELNRLTAFARESVEVARALLRLLDPAILAAEILTATGTCPVCSTAVEDDRGICGRCGTPHHRDCWTYLGGCAIYACAGRPSRLRSLPARSRVG